MNHNVKKFLTFFFCLDQMKNLTGGGGDETKEAAGGGEVDPEVEEERQRIEEERRLKHERFEAERQKMRQDIRDKVRNT